MKHKQRLKIRCSYPPTIGTQVEVEVSAYRGLAPSKVTGTINALPKHPLYTQDMPYCKVQVLGIEVTFQWKTKKAKEATAEL